MNLHTRLIFMVTILYAQLVKFYKNKIIRQGWQIFSIRALTANILDFPDDVVSCNYSVQLLITLKR